MSLHLLGVSRADEIDSSQSAVRWIVHDPLAAAAVRPLSGVSGPLRHARFLEAIHQRANILPVRYGVVLPNEVAVHEFLRSREQALLDNLSQVAGAGEMGLRMELANPPVSSCAVAAQSDPRLPATSAGQYLARRRAGYQRQDETDQQVRQAVDQSVQALAGLYRRWVRLTQTEPGLARLAFLVDRDRWEGFRSRAAELNGIDAIRHCFCLGPWPPYSFV